MTNKVCVTGIGVISSVGEGKETFWHNIVAGVSGVTEITSFDTSKFSVHKGGEIKTFNPSQYGINGNYGRSSQLGIAACQMALKDAGLKQLDNEKVAVIIGTTMGEGQLLQEIDEIALRNENDVPRLLISQFPANNIADNISNFLKVKGLSLIIPNACAAGNFAISYAYDLIMQNEYDMIIAGGVDAMSKIAFTGFSRIFAIAPEKCQPFDKSRKGIIVGEGAALLILESIEHAKKRNANIYAEIAGYGLSADASHMMIPHEDGIYMAMSNALENSKLDNTEIDYICAHGTGTVANDRAEAKAIRKLFDKHADAVHVSSIKSMLGHTMGAASAIESVACVLCLDSGYLPPNINLIEQDPECPIICVANTSMKKEPRVVMNNAFAFGGNNACVIFRKIE